jgi:hypothetical protein
MADRKRGYRACNASNTARGSFVMTAWQQTYFFFVRGSTVHAVVEEVSPFVPFDCAV